MSTAVTTIRQSLAAAVVAVAPDAAWEQGITGKQFAEALTGAIEQSGLSLDHLYFTIEYGQTVFLERGTGVEQASTPFALVVAYRMRAGPTSLIPDIDACRDVGDTILRALVAHKGPDYTIAPDYIDPLGLSADGSMCAAEVGVRVLHDFDYAG